MKKVKISKIYDDLSDSKSAIKDRVIKHFPQAEYEKLMAEDGKKESLFKKHVVDGKRELLLSEAKGESLKPCPGTDDSYICCNYWVLNQATNCPIECSYCILQYYLTNPVLTLYTNIDKMKNEILSRTALEPKRFMRIGTGELADSLVIDDINRAGENFVLFAAEHKNFLLELKTKSNTIDHLLSLNHQGYTILSWSLNPQEIISKEELRSASLSERLLAASLAEKAGYKLGFHFDPMLYYDGWEKGYASVIEQLFSHISGKNIAWISIGSLRFPPEMKSKALDKYPRSKIFLEEMIIGKDNKQRYIKPIRLKMYKHLYALLKKYGGEDLFIYFCMEDKEVWDEVMAFSPESKEHLDYLFAESLYGRFPGLLKNKPNYEDYKTFITPHSRDK